MERRYDIDWLRVLATLLLFVFHTAMVFNPAPFFHIRNEDLSLAMLVLCGFISLWHMPLFFLLAGWSIHRSVTERGAGGVVRERVRRLVVPLAAGIVLFMPLIKYLELSSGLELSHDGLRVAPHLQAGFRLILPEDLPAMAPFEESFADFLPTFFTRLDRFTWAHLWFVAYLFTFTLLYLPAFAWLARRPQSDAAGPPPPLLVYAPILPLAVVQLVLRPYWPGVQNLYDDWANFAYYSTYFWCGFLLARSPALEASVQGEWRRALAIATGAALVLLGSVLGLIRSPSVLLATSAVAGWCFVVAILGLGHRFLDFGNRALEYLSEAAFPVYVLHQAAIVVPGYFLIRLPLGVAAKFLLVLAVAVGLTVAAYELVVRRFPLGRALFGMRPLARRATPRPRPLAARGAPLAALLLALAGPITDARAASPVGLWWAEGGAAQVDVEPCGDRLCGRIVWLRSPLDEHGCELTDAANPERALRSRPLVGLAILDGLVADAGQPGTWRDGRIYDPTSGTTYRCTVRLDGDDRLAVRGYYGIELLGRTTTWVRVGGEGRSCEARHAGAY